MNDDIIIKLERFVSVLYLKFKEHNDRITICAVASAQYINYLCEKGQAFCSDKKDLCLRSLNIIESQFGTEIPDFIKNGLLEIMQEVKSYEYEIIGFFIKNINELK